MTRDQHPTEAQVGSEIVTLDGGVGIVLDLVSEDGDEFVRATFAYDDRGDPIEADAKLVPLAEITEVTTT